jgi:hypothetical protein
MNSIVEIAFFTEGKYILMVLENDYERIPQRILNLGYSVSVVSIMLYNASFFLCVETRTIFINDINTVGKFDVPDRYN